MPYVAIQNGDRVGPWEVEDGTDVDCPLCDDAMRPRCGEGTKRERHFWHYKGTECSGESDEHRRMKAIAAARARECWPDAEVGIEVATGGIDTVRVADVLVTFDEFHDTLGAGLAIECQYRNEQKDYTQVSWDHAQANYSTVWLESEHFNGREVNIGAGDWREWRSYWCLPPEHMPKVWNEYRSIGLNPGEREFRDLSNLKEKIKRSRRPKTILEYRWHDLSDGDVFGKDKTAYITCPECGQHWKTTLNKIRKHGEDWHLCDHCSWGGTPWDCMVRFSPPYGTGKNYSVVIDE